MGTKRQEPDAIEVVSGIWGEVCPGSGCGLGLERGEGVSPGVPVEFVRAGGVDGFGPATWVSTSGVAEPGEETGTFGGSPLAGPEEDGVTGRIGVGLTTSIGDSSTPGEGSPFPSVPGDAEATGEALGEPGAGCPWYPMNPMIATRRPTATS